MGVLVRGQSDGATDINARPQTGGNVVDFEPQVGVVQPQHALPRITVFDPVDDGDVDDSVPGPGLRGDGFGDDPAVVSHVVQRRLPRGGLADGLGGNQPGAAAVGQVVVREGKPVADEVRDPTDVRVPLLETVVVGGTELIDHLPSTEEGRVADDGVRFGPGHEQGVSRGDDVVEVVQREDPLVVVELVGGQLLGQHHGHLGDFDGEGVAVDAGEVVGVT